MEHGNEFVQPLFPSRSLVQTVAFYRALGFEVVQDTRDPYPYAEVRYGSLWIHCSDLRVYGAKHVCGAFLVMVADVALYHQHFASGLRATYGRIPTAGMPRITRLRPGQTRFCVFDPTGNMLIFLARDAPEVTTWGSNNDQSALIHVLHNAAFLRDTYANDTAAASVLEKALRKHPEAAAVDRARVLAAIAELAVAMGDSARARTAQAELQHITLAPQDHDRFRDELHAADNLERWLLQSGGAFDEQ
jgi:catechol 2,3-dioxygenase-like lactoylglutathione lyase family enzyme